MRVTWRWTFCFPGLPVAPWVYVEFHFPGSLTPCPSFGFTQKFERPVDEKMAQKHIGKFCFVFAHLSRVLNGARGVVPC